jgi:ketosteroid isomerase-like protein
MPGSAVESPEAFVRRMFRCLNADGIKAVAERFFDADVEYQDDAAWPGGGVHVGRAAVIARFEEVIEVLGIHDVGVERVVDAGNQLAWVITASGQSTVAEVPNDHRWGYVGRITDGKLAYFRAYYDADAAIAAVTPRG